MEKFVDLHLAPVQRHEAPSDHGMQRRELNMYQHWNHSIHYYPLLLAAVPSGADLVLDVGCGVGTLSQALQGRVRRVVGIDSDEVSIAQARTMTDTTIEYVLGDILSHPFNYGSFDAVLSVATLHHMDVVAGLQRMGELARPGGLVGVIGLARDESWKDLVFAGMGRIANMAYRATKGYWEHSSPRCWPPPEGWESMRRISARVLPGSRFCRHLLWRYSLIWEKPAAPRHQ
jgi:2-polyprenyl-3-methyl-5-hydroxy-6-metoxy-1,4-benzoquinol methylase